MTKNWGMINKINRNRLASQVRKTKIETPQVGKTSFMNPFQLLPNVKKFTLGGGSLDPLLRRFGVKKMIRVAPLYEKYTNGAANRYILHQVERLNKCRGDKDRYWTIARQILRRSNVFLVLALNHINPQWQRKNSMKQVWLSIKGYKNIVRKGWNDIDFRRTYIAKPNGKLRPLGVPTTPWRMYLYLLNQLLSIYLQEHQPRNQHGFWPGRSTITAWHQIIEETLKAPDIFEFDLKGYFDNIEIQYISTKLESLGVPKGVVYHIEDLNKSTPKLTQDDKVVELKREVQELQMCLAYEKEPTKGLWYKPVQEFIDANGREMWNMLLNEEVGQLYGPRDLRSKPLLCELKYVENQWAILSSLTGEEKFHSVFKGVPQGSPTSPLLSTIVLKDFLESGKVGIVQYADDGIVYGENIRKLVSDHKGHIVVGSVFEPFGRMGVEVNWEKSGWVKEAGVWKRNLKFLGLEYDPFREVWRAKTRNGSVLEYDRQHLARAVTLRDLDSERELNDIINQARYELDKRPERCWEDWLSSKIKGYIMSRMYAGSWNLENFTQDFSYTFVKNSWSFWKSKKSKSGELDIFNSSSVASRSIMNALKSRWQYRAESKV